MGLGDNTGMTAKQGFVRSILTTALGAIASVAAVFGIGTIGWYASIYFHGVQSKVESIYTTSNLNEVKLMNDELRKHLAADEDRIRQLSQQLVLVASQPIDKDWRELNYRFIELFAAVCKAANYQHDVRGVAGAIATIIAQRSNTNAVLIGAGLMTTRTIGGINYVVMTKYPQCGVVWETGEMKTLAQ
jgi:hypothetical protein